MFQHRFAIQARFVFWIWILLLLILGKSHAQLTASSPALSTTTATHSVLDTLLTFFARDTNRYDIRARKLYLVGNAWIQYRHQRLEAHRILVDFNTETLIAEAADSNGAPLAKFQDGSEVFFGKRIEYNFRSRKGRILVGRTARSEGRYGGTIVKRVSPTTYFIQNGLFTTCDNPLPHYAFVAPKMRVEVGEKIFTDPLLLTIEEFPIIGIPFGIFVDARRGRRSGFLVPAIFFSTTPGSLNRGTIIENLGYYWAINEYMDTKFALRLTTKGGFTLFNTTRYAVRHHLNGTIQAAYGFTRTSPLLPYTTDWHLQWQHQQQFGKRSRLDIRLNFSSAKFFQNTATDLQERVQQQLRSDASFYHQFRNGSSIALYYQRTQDLTDGSVSELLPRIQFTLPQWYPLRNLTTIRWLRNFNVQYTVSAFRQRYDTTTKMRIEHRPRIALLPKFRYFSITPSLSYAENWYFRKLYRTVVGDSLRERVETGFFREYQYTIGISVSTRLYGIAYLQWQGIEAVRHILQPTISWRYLPDLSDPQLGMYGTYRDPSTGAVVRYSHFEKDGGGVSTTQQQLLSLNFDNTFEAKIWVNDTTTKVIRLLNLNLNATYNAAADSIRWSPITISGRTEIGKFLFLSGTARFLLYEQVPDPLNPTQYRTVNRFLIHAGRGIARLTDANLTLSLTFQSSSPSTKPATQKDQSASQSSTMPAPAAYHLTPGFWGNNAPGVLPLAIQWQWTATLQLSYNAPTPRTVRRSAYLSFRGAFAIAHSWNLSGGFSLDLNALQLNSPYLELRKDLHCWNFYLRWYPSGFSQGIYLRIGIKAAQLRDIKIEKRTGPIYF